MDDLVSVKKNDFSGIVTMCAIRGDPKNPEIEYFIQGKEKSGWYPERLIEKQEVE
jgi:hypothetical protein